MIDIKDLPEQLRRCGNLCSTWSHAADLHSGAGYKTLNLDSSVNGNMNE